MVGGLLILYQASKVTPLTQPQPSIEDFFKKKFKLAPPYFSFFYLGIDPILLIKLCNYDFEFLVKNVSSLPPCLNKRIDPYLTNPPPLLEKILTLPFYD